MVSDSQKMGLAMLLSFGLGFVVFNKGHPSRNVQLSDQVADRSVAEADRAPRAAVSDTMVVEDTDQSLSNTVKASSVEITVQYAAKGQAKVRLGLSATDAAVKEAIATATGVYCCH
jgi:hypothetical protein